MAEGELTLLIPAGSRATFDQDRLGVIAASTRTDGTVVLTLDPERLARGVPNPRLSSPASGTGDWTAKQVVEAVALLRRAVSPVMPLSEREAVERWLEENHPSPETYIAAMKEAALER